MFPTKSMMTNTITKFTALAGLIYVQVGYEDLLFY